ncbi:MAG: twitching motility protein PilT [Geobacteraceae bacterium GWC2_58_44]|nr:MAG: twitching motility protein PilT [Geobacteraceae bacterium GWC2_58_44]HBG07297.1 VapC toxin family PIN domain ribonuclease [Geobacter sp.]
MRVFIDTSGFLSVLDRDDYRHAASRKAWVDLLSSDAELLTTNYVLLETFALVQNRLGLPAVRLFQDDIVPVLHIEWIGKTQHENAAGILLSALRRKLSLVDCTSFAAMRLLGVTTAFTLDKHFKEQGFDCMPAE